MDDLVTGVAPLLETAGDQLLSGAEPVGAVTAIVDEVAPSAPAIELPRIPTGTAPAAVTTTPEDLVRVVAELVRRSIDPTGVTDTAGVVDTTAVDTTAVVDTIGVAALAAPRLATGDLLSPVSSSAPGAAQPAPLPFSALGATGGTGAGSTSGQDGSSADLAIRSAGNPLAAGGRCGGAACGAARHVAFDPSFSPD